MSATVAAQLLQQVQTEAQLGGCPLYVRALLKLGHARWCPVQPGSGPARIACSAGISGSANGQRAVNFSGCVMSQNFLVGLLQHVVTATQQTPLITNNWLWSWGNGADHVGHAGYVGHAATATPTTSGERQVAQAEELHSARLGTL